MNQMLGIKEPRTFERSEREGMKDPEFAVVVVFDGDRNGGAASAP